jgi:hypothetical protein
MGLQWDESCRGGVPHKHSEVVKGGRGGVLSNKRKGMTRATNGHDRRCEANETLLTNMIMHDNMTLPDP